VKHSKPQPPPATPLDPVTQYATDVVEGRVIAARLVRLACQRHLNDLRDATHKGLVWKADRAQDVIDFFRDVLCLPDESDDGEAAKRFVLSPFQAFIAGSLFGWYTAEGYRRFRIGYVETAKGSGKTPFGAGLMLYLLVADGERGAQVYCAAVTKDQAKLAFTDAENMVEISPDLSEHVDKRVNNLAVPPTRSFLRPISSENRGLDGKRVHGALVDELHEHPTNLVYLKLRAGTKNRKNALILEITNSGFDRNSICWEHHDLSRQILEGTVVNDSWFAFVCHLDPCARCLKAGKHQPSDDCTECDDWKTEGPHWQKANPNLGVSLSWQYLREQVREAIDLPSQRNLVRRLNFCQWTQQATVWIPPEAWMRCGGAVSRDQLAGRDCYLGIDMADKIDLASVVAAFPRELAADDRRAADDEDDGATPAIERPITCAYDVLAFFWMPEKTLARRAQEDKIPYPDWVRDGYVFTTPGKLIDHDAIVDYIIGTLHTTFRIRGIGIDQAGAAGVVSKLQRHFGDELVEEVPQGFRRLSEPSKTLEAMVVTGNLAHDNNPCQAWCMGNMAIEENSWREIRPVKIHQRKRIDGGVALIDAIAKHQKSNPTSDRSVYEDRGLATA
jgi:phage terminase large subunit-like protein